MFPLFYYNPSHKRCKWNKEHGYVAVVIQQKTYGTVENNEFKPLPDQSWVLRQFKNMVFLDECYWEE